MKRSFIVCAMLAGVVLAPGNVFAQKNKKDKKADAAPAAPVKPAVDPNEGFTKMDNGLFYKLVGGPHTGMKPGVGDFVEMHIIMHVGDSILFDSRKMNENKPVQFPMQPPRVASDPSTAFMQIPAGDDAIVRVPLDTMKKMGMQAQPWMKEGEMVEYKVTMVSVKTAAEMKAEEEKKAAAQNGIDDKLLQDYFTKNSLKPTKTASGLYYSLKEEPNAVKSKTKGKTPANSGIVKPQYPQAGQKLVMNYTGKTLNGNTFDSNVDSNFHHVQPFEFTLGQGQVIKGWDEGIMLIPKGRKGVLYIPSSLAYGSQARGAAIPANAILIFDVEVVDIK